MKLKLLKEQRGSGMCVCLDSTRITNQKIYGFLDTVREWEVDPKQIAGIIGYPQVHAWWVPEGVDRVCSYCGWTYAQEIRFMTEGDGGFDFCPHCGAVMDGGETNAPD